MVGNHSITEVGPQHCFCSFEMRFHSVAQVDLKLLNANNPYTSASRELGMPLYLAEVERFIPSLL